MEMPDEMTTDAETSVNRAIDKFRSGGIVIIVDDEERENEGDFRNGGRDGYAGGRQFHGAARARAHLRAHAERRPRPARPSPHGGQEHRAIGYRVYGFG